MADPSTARLQLEERFGAGLPADVVAEGEWYRWIAVNLYTTLAHKTTAASSILRLYALSPADLYFKWEAFLLSSNSQNSLPFNLDNLRELKKEIQLSANANSAAHVKRENGSLSSTPGGPAGAGSRVKKLASRAALDGM